MPKAPLHNGGSDRWRKYFPTVTFALKVNLPPDAFKLADKVVSGVNLARENLHINVPDKLEITDIDVEVDKTPNQ